MWRWLTKCHFRVIFCVYPLKIQNTEELNTFFTENVHNPGLESRNSSVWLTHLHRISESVISHKKTEYELFRRTSRRRFHFLSGWCEQMSNILFQRELKRKQRASSIDTSLKGYRSLYTGTSVIVYLRFEKTFMMLITSDQHGLSLGESMCIMAVTDLNQSTKTSRSCLNLSSLCKVHAMKDTSIPQCWCRPYGKDFSAWRRRVIWQGEGCPLWPAASWASPSASFSVPPRSWWTTSPPLR